MYKETSKANTGEFVKMWKRTKPNLTIPKKTVM